MQVLKVMLIFLKESPVRNRCFMLFRTENDFKNSKFKTYLKNDEISESFISRASELTTFYYIFNFSKTLTFQKHTKNA